MDYLDDRSGDRSTAVPTKDEADTMSYSPIPDIDPPQIKTEPLFGDERGVQLSPWQYLIKVVLFRDPHGPSHVTLETLVIEMSDLLAQFKGVVNTFCVVDQVWSLSSFKVSRQLLTKT